ncbi:MAG: MerR family transcriptional regulator [Candidatus Nanopelagicales bacterium]|nr:MerR family transcriptional regulator [Candidatus Nanopelagicales bacterium]MDZ4249427.1 MerR family transcriptional regulator [Candidatus Nanopelagicales bacterium]
MAARIRADVFSGRVQARQPGLDDPVYVMSVAATLAGLHPQTLRQYDRLGLVTPARSGGRNRLYSMRDILRLQQIQRLSDEGVNLAGILRILDLEAEIDSLRERLEDVVGRERSRALVVWSPDRRRRA